MSDVQRSCLKCGISLDPASDVCPECVVREIHANDFGRGREEFVLQSRDATGKSQREMASRTDGEKEGITDIDRTGTDVKVRRTGTRSGPMNNLTDENSSVAALCNALNNRDGSAYKPQIKEKEDSDVPDVWISDERSTAAVSDRRVGVQVTHFDCDAIADLGSKRSYDLLSGIHAITNAVVTAIAKKQNVDPVLARKTFLLLICPYPIRESIQEEFRYSIMPLVPLNLYRETWIASFREPPFQIQ